MGWAVLLSSLILLGIVFINMTIVISEPRNLHMGKDLTEAVIKDQSRLIQDCIQKIVQLEKEVEQLDENMELHQSLVHFRDDTRAKHQEYSHCSGCC